MIHRVPNPSASRFRPGAVGVRAVLLGLSVCTVWVACVPVGVPRDPPSPEASGIPAIEVTSAFPSDVLEGTQVLQAAIDSLELGEWEGAQRTAQRVVRHYPGMPGSGEALGILGRSSISLGLYEEAAEAADQYVALLGPSHRLYPSALLLHSEALAALGDRDQSLEKLLSLPSGSPAAVLDPARDLLRRFLEDLNSGEVRDLAESAPPSHPLLSVLAAQYSAALYLMGEEDQAVQWARTALASAPGEQDEELARSVLEGNIDQALGPPVVMGTILPFSEVSPGLLQYSEWINEGIQVAVEQFRGDFRRPVQLEVMDDGGLPLGGRRSVQELEASGAFCIIGPLTRNVLAEVASARAGDLPIISPSAFLPLDEATGVYSLSGPDPGGARMVARYAWDLGLERVVVLRPRTAESQVDARAFLDEFEELGGIIPREIVYDSGATFFQQEFDEVGSLIPDGLFLPLTPRDIELLAPQFTYYGLDTLGIQLVGTSGWATDEVVLGVDSRHTDGVIASTTRISQDETEASLRFREAYETLFQKSLRSEVPAFGYDAAALFLEAFGSGARTSSETLTALEGIRDFPGATGRLTIEAGRITREPHLVRIQNHELIYISSRFD